MTRSQDTKPTSTTEKCSNLTECLSLDHNILNMDFKKFQDTYHHYLHGHNSRKNIQSISRSPKQDTSNICLCESEYSSIPDDSEMNEHTRNDLYRKSSNAKVNIFRLAENDDDNQLAQKVRETKEIFNFCGKQIQSQNKTPAESQEIIIFKNENFQIIVRESQRTVGTENAGDKCVRKQTKVQEPRTNIERSASHGSFCKCDQSQHETPSFTSRGSICKCHQLQTGTSYPVTSPKMMYPNDSSKKPTKEPQNWEVCKKETRKKKKEKPISKYQQSQHESPSTSQGSICKCHQSHESPTVARGGSTCKYQQSQASKGQPITSANKIHLHADARKLSQEVQSDREMGLKKKENEIFLSKYHQSQHEYPSMSRGSICKIHKLQAGTSQAITLTNRIHPNVSSINLSKEAQNGDVCTKETGKKKKEKAFCKFQQSQHVSSFISPCSSCNCHQLHESPTKARGSSSCKCQQSQAGKSHAKTLTNRIHPNVSSIKLSQDAQNGDVCTKETGKKNKEKPFCKFQQSEHASSLVAPCSSCKCHQSHESPIKARGGSSCKCQQSGASKSQLITSANQTQVHANGRKLSQEAQNGKEIEVKKKENKKSFCKCHQLKGGKQYDTPSISGGSICKFHQSKAGIQLHTPSLSRGHICKCDQSKTDLQIDTLSTSRGSSKCHKSNTSESHLLSPAERMYSNVSHRSGKRTTVQNMISSKNLHQIDQQKYVPIDVGNFEKLINPSKKFEVKLSFKEQPSRVDCKRNCCSRQEQTSFLTKSVKKSKNAFDLESYLLGELSKEVENGEVTKNESEKKKKHKEIEKPFEKEKQKKEKKNETGETEKSTKKNVATDELINNDRRKRREEKSSSNLDNKNNNIEKVLSKYRIQTINENESEKELFVHNIPQEVKNIEEGIVFKHIREIVPKELGELIVIKKKASRPKTHPQECNPRAWNFSRP